MPQILVVEDNRSLATMAKNMIGNLPGFEADIAVSRADAQEAILKAGQKYTAALVDLNLPDAPNGEVVEVIQAYRIPVVVMTGFFADSVREKVLKMGVVDYIIKKNLNAYQYACRLIQRLHLNSSCKTLLVDDSRSARSVLKHYLEIQQLDVIEANNGAEALKQFQEHPDIKLVLTDYNMPKVDGFELIQKLREQYSKDRLAIIGLSSSDDPRLSAHFLKSGANDFIGKPFGYEELLCRVNQNLEHLEQIEVIRDAANRDYLTRLYNRRFFFEESSKLRQRALTQEQPMSLSMIDVDHFKSINDNYGHQAGDQALRHIATQLEQAFPDDLIARFGGEEFCILHQGNSEDSYQRLEQFRQTLANSPVPIAPPIPITVSIGLHPATDHDLEQVIHNADAKLYKAKQWGRNRIIA